MHGKKVAQLAFRSMHFAIELAEVHFADWLSFTWSICCQL